MLTPPPFTAVAVVGLVKLRDSKTVLDLATIATAHLDGEHLKLTLHSGDKLSIEGSDATAIFQALSEYAVTPESLIRSASLMPAPEIYSGAEQLTQPPIPIAPFTSNFVTDDTGSADQEGEPQVAAPSGLSFNTNPGPMPDVPPPPPDLYKQPDVVPPPTKSSDTPATTIAKEDIPY